MGLTERIVWSAPPDFPGIEILFAENSQRPWREYHETYTICNINPLSSQDGASGAADWIYRGRTYCSVPESVMLIEPGELHRNTKTPPPNPFSVLFIHPKIIAEIACESGMSANPHFREAVSTDSGLYRSLVRLHEALSHQTTLLHRQSVLVGCIGAILAGYCEKTPREAVHPGLQHLRRARDFLAEHLPENVELHQLAKVSGLSRFHFLRAFAKEFGVPPHRYLISLRISKARHLLKAGIPADEAAAEVGFSDQSHLIRHFKSEIGVTPGTYVAMVRSGFGSF